MNVRFLFGCLFVTSFALQVTHAQEPPASPQALETRGDVQFVHDPAIIREGATWYLFSTGNGPGRKGEIPIRCSQDLHQWRNCGSVLAQIPEWIKKESPETKELWAPDVSFLNGGSRPSGFQRAPHRIAARDARPDRNRVHTKDALGTSRVDTAGFRPLQDPCEENASPPLETSVTSDHPRLNALLPSPVMPPTESQCRSAQAPQISCVRH
jgi:hypothetical protein